MRLFHDEEALREELDRAMSRLESLGVRYDEGDRQRILRTYTHSNVPYPYIILHIGDPRIKNHFYYSTCLNEKGCILDYGCGTGDSVRQLLRDGYPRERITGFDINPKSISLGLDLYADHLVNKDLFTVSDTFPYKPELFDTVYSGSVFHVIEDEGELTDYLKNAYDALQPGGILFGSTLGLTDLLTERPENGPPRLMKQDEIIRFLKQAGFSHIEITESAYIHIQRPSNGFCAFEFLAKKPDTRQHGSAL